MRRWRLSWNRLALARPRERASFERGAIAPDIRRFLAPRRLSPQDAVDGIGALFRSRIPQVRRSEPGLVRASGAAPVTTTPGSDRFERPKAVARADVSGRWCSSNGWLRHFTAEEQAAGRDGEFGDL